MTERCIANLVSRISNTLVYWPFYASHELVRDKDVIIRVLLEVAAKAKNAKTLHDWQPTKREKSEAEMMVWQTMQAVATYAMDFTPVTEEPGGRTDDQIARD